MEALRQVRAICGNLSLNTEQFLSKKRKASQSVSVLSLAARFLSTTHFKHETTVFQMLASTLLHVDFSPEIWVLHVLAFWKLACEMNLLTGRSIGSPDGGFKSCVRGKSAPSRAKRIQTVQLNCITRDRLHREINNHYCVWRAGYLRAASSGRMKTQTVQPRGNDKLNLLELNCRAEQREHIGPPELRYPARASSALHVKSQTVYVQGYHGTALQRSTTVCPINTAGPRAYTGTRRTCHIRSNRIWG